MWCKGISLVPFIFLVIPFGSPTFLICSFNFLASNSSGLEIFLNFKPISLPKRLTCLLTTTSEVPSGKYFLKSEIFIVC